MRSLHRLLLLLAAATAAASAVAAQQALPRPYAPVAIQAEPPEKDEGFVAFRGRLAEAARHRLFADLVPLVREREFFWDRDFSHGFDPRKPGVDNLAAAIGLERDSGSGWERLAEFAAMPAGEALPSRFGVICAPARPLHDAVAFSELLQTTYTSTSDWSYPRSAATPVRSTPQSDAPVIATLGASFVRLLGFEGHDGKGSTEGSSWRTRWARVALPDGRIGYVAPNGLISLTPEQLCYARDLVARWQVAGFISGGN